MSGCFLNSLHTELQLAIEYCYSQWPKGHETCMIKMQNTLFSATGAMRVTTGISTSHSKQSTTSAKGPIRAIHFTSGTSETHPTNEIWFYDRLSPYYEFTNFYRRPVKINDKQWPTTEHYFQAQKFIGTPYEEHIRKLSSAREAFQFSRKPQVQRWIRSDWNTVKDEIMKLALLNKFEQHSDLGQKLIDTGEKKLVEHTSNDSYWGDGGDGKGKNRLGELLMEVREFMKSKRDCRSGRTHSSLRRSSSMTELRTKDSYYSSHQAAGMDSRLYSQVHQRSQSRTTTLYPPWKY